MGPISAKHGQILLKFGSFESLGQKLQQDPCASRLRDLAAFLESKTQQERTTPNQRNRFRCLKAESIPFGELRLAIQFFLEWAQH